MNNNMIMGAAVLSLFQAITVSAEVEPVPAMQSDLAVQELVLDVAETSDGLVAVGERGHILLSKNGEDWQQAIGVPHNRSLTAVTANGSHIWAVGHDMAIVYSADNGLNWSLQNFQPDMMQPLLDVWFADNSKGLAIGAYGAIMRTYDGGQTWEEDVIHWELDYHLNGITQTPTGRLVIAGEAGYGFVSDDMGETWTEFEFPYGGSMFGVLSLPDGSLLAYGLRGHMHKSTDDGETWVDVDSPTQLTLMGGMIDASGNPVLVGANAVILTGNADGSFRMRRHPVGEDLSNIIEFNGKKIVVGEEGIIDAEAQEGGAS